jgi:hypothetical protein
MEIYGPHDRPGKVRATAASLICHDASDSMAPGFMLRLHSLTVQRQEPPEVQSTRQDALVLTYIIKHRSERFRPTLPFLNIVVLELWLRQMINTCAMEFPSIIV